MSVLLGGGVSVLLGGGVSVLLGGGVSVLLGSAVRAVPRAEVGDQQRHLDCLFVGDLQQVLRLGLQLVRLLRVIVLELARDQPCQNRLRQLDFDVERLFLELRNGNDRLEIFLEDPLRAFVQAPHPRDAHKAKHHDHDRHDREAAQQLCSDRDPFSTENLRADALSRRFHC